MNQIKRLKRLLGKQYSFQKLMSEKQIEQLKCKPPSAFEDTAVAALTAACVKIEAVLFLSPAGIELAYDIFVKDEPESSEWICYDSLAGPVSLREADMLEALDRAVRGNGLSYTECSFKRMNGKLKNEGVK